jgi:hypothetical protein
MEALVFAYSSLPTSPRISRRLSLSLASILAAVTFTTLSGGPPAAAAQSAGAATCPTTVVSQPFVKWGDSNSYALVPGGDFELTPSEWTLSGGAQRVAGSESYAATGALGAWSLALPAGASAQTPFMCVGATERTFRLFARGEGFTAAVLPQVVYQTPFGNLAVPVGLIVPNRNWEPTAILKTGAPLATAIANGTVRLALRFTSLVGSSRIDDVLLDPRMRR